MYGEPGLVGGTEGARVSGTAAGQEDPSVTDPEPRACKILPFRLALHMPPFQEPTEGKWCHYQLSEDAENSLTNLPLGANVGQDTKTIWFQGHDLVSLAFNV